MLRRPTRTTPQAALFIALLMIGTGCSDAGPADTAQAETQEDPTADTDQGDGADQQGAGASSTPAESAAGTGASAHYPLEKDLASVGSAPALQPIGDVQLVDDDDLTGEASLEFGPDGGLALDVSELITSDTYTLAFRFYLDSDDSGWLKLVDLDDRRSDRGFYVYDGGLQFHGHTEVHGEAPLGGRPYATVAVRRDADERLSWFVNGEHRADVDDSELDQGVLGSDTLHFFVDDSDADDSGEEASSGRVAWLTVYDQPLGDSSIFELSAG